MFFENGQWPVVDGQRECKMRNLRCKESLRQKLESVTWEVPRPPDFSCTIEDIEQVMNELGLVGNGSPKDVWAVAPPKGQSSMGINVTYDWDILTGLKGERYPVDVGSSVWPSLQNEAELIREYCDQRQFTFAELKDPKLSRDVCRDVHCFYTLGTRVDGNWANPRLIFVGGARLYPFGMAMFDGVYADIKLSPFIATRPSAAVYR
jgi:hypothetical protein